MSKIRESARDATCQINIPGICNHDSSTVVLAHYRMLPFCGTGIKPPDNMGAYACSACHDEVDERTNSGYTRGSLKQLHLEGVMRTQAILIRKGLMVIK